MKKNVLKKLETAAAWLPKETEPAIRKMLGSDIIAKGSHIDKNGKSIIKGRVYDVPFKRPVNHVEKMKAAYKSGGFPAVDKYLEKYKDRIEMLMKLPSNQKTQTV